MIFRLYVFRAAWITLACIATALIVSRALAGSIVEFTPEQSVVLNSIRQQAFREGEDAAASAVEEACREQGRFIVQAGQVSREYRCSPNWI